LSILQLLAETTLKELVGRVIRPEMAAEFRYLPPTPSYP
jgi:hypothetical protein